MRSHKRMRTKGKFSFTGYFKKLLPGDSVAVVMDLTFPFYYKKQIQGRTGKIISQKGSSYEVEIKDMDKPKRYNLHPIHLKKIINSK
jgi:ribosomal protein L21E